MLPVEHCVRTTIPTKNPSIKITPCLPNAKPQTLQAFKTKNWGTPRIFPHKDDATNTV